MLNLHSYLSVVFEMARTKQTARKQTPKSKVKQPKSKAKQPSPNVPPKVVDDEEDLRDLTLLEVPISFFIHFQMSEKKRAAPKDSDYVYDEPDEESDEESDEDEQYPLTKKAYKELEGETSDVVKEAASKGVHQRKKDHPKPKLPPKKRPLPDPKDKAPVKKPTKRQKTSPKGKGAKAPDKGVPSLLLC